MGNLLARAVFRFLVRCVPPRTETMLPPGGGALSHSRGDREGRTINPPQPSVLRPCPPTFVSPTTSTRPSPHHSNHVKSNLSSFINVARRGAVMLIGIMLLFRPADMSRLTNVQHQILKGITQRPTIRSGRLRASPSFEINSSAFFNCCCFIVPNMHWLWNSLFWSLSLTYPITHSFFAHTQLWPLRHMVMHFKDIE